MGSLSGVDIDIRLSEALKEKDFEGLHEFIESHNTPESFAGLEILSWLLRQIDDTTIVHPPDFEAFVTSHIQDISRNLSSREFLLVLLGELESRESLNLLSFSMPFLESCALSIGLTKTPDMNSLFECMRSIIHQFLLKIRKPRPFKPDSIFTKLVRNVGNMLMALFQQDVDKSNFESYADVVLYYFAEPLYFIDLSDNTVSVFESFLCVLWIILPSLYSACYEIYWPLYTHSNIDFSLSEFTDRNIALLFVVNLCLSHNSFHSFLPSVFTKIYKFEMFVYMSVPYVQKLANNLAQGNALSYIDIRRLIRTQEGLINLSSDVKECYPSEWWRTQPVSLIKNFESICKYPIMAENLPIEIKNCVLAIESLLSTATVTARCELFVGIIDRSANPPHHGLRAHMIVCFKNFLHSYLSSWNKNTLPNTKDLKEVDVTLPYYPDYLRQMFDLIFKYPLPGCGDNVIDQSSWLNAALNFAFYISLRYKAVRESDFDVELKTIMHDIALALSRPDEKGKSTLKTKFLEPLSGDIIELSNKYRRAEKEYESNPDPATIAPNAPSLRQCELTLNDLRLLMTNLSYIGDLPVS
ncbi:hypothetical protein Aperf_G00000015469 [Anoplocephala perfoliata]